MMVDLPVYGRIRRAANERPEARAIIGAHGPALTYGVLEEEAHRLEAALRSAGCRASDRVAVLVPPSTDSAVAALGVLTAGCVYVPLDPGRPAPRTADVLRHTEPKAVIATRCQSALVERLRARKAPGIDTLIWMRDAERARGAGSTGGDGDGRPWRITPGATRRDDDPACVLMSRLGGRRSRTTRLTHGDLRRRVEWLTRHFELGTDDRVLSDAPPGTELALVDLLAASAAGAELHRAPKRPRADHWGYPDLLEERGITVWLAWPSEVSRIAACRELDGRALHRLRHVAWCAEPLPDPCLTYWRERAPGTALTSLCDATDTSPGDRPGRDLGIGTGRHRVHPVDVESELLGVDTILACAVVTAPGPDGRARVGCAYVPRDGRPLRTGPIEERLTRRLPAALVPRSWLRLEELPVDARGQVDRDLLQRMFGGDPEERANA